jgi:aminopeptidase N
MQSVERLIETIKPSRYRLTIEPNLSDFTFTGQETIEFELVEPSKELVFHCKDLEISEASIGQEAVVVNYDQENQTVTFTAKNELKASEYSMDLSFNGKMDDSLEGFYRSRYEVNGEEKWLGTTQFESTYARQAFVCIDEPAVKYQYKQSRGSGRKEESDFCANTKDEYLLIGLAGG